MSRVILVSCVSIKQAKPSKAADLYVSPWFVKARRLVETTGDPWFILSAKYGLTDPNSEIDPYDVTLNFMSTSEKRAWAETVQRQMETDLPDADEVVILAGKNYREFLQPYLSRRYSKISVPMEGLGIGRQLNWLDNAKTV